MRIETVELDDRNIAHVTTRVSATEICEVFDNGPVFHRNKSGRTADYAAIGVTDGGSRVRINFIYDPRHCPSGQCLEADMTRNIPTR